jgi:hypothetical protein
MYVERQNKLRITHKLYNKLKMNLFRMPTNILQNDNWFISQLMQILVRRPPPFLDNAVYHPDIFHIYMY